MSEDAPAKVWLYEDGRWELADDPITWSTDEADDVHAKYAEAGYTEAARRDQPAEGFLVLGLGTMDAKPAARLTLFVRRERPECLIDIEGPAMSTRSVYAARLPDGLDLMAHWAPIAQAGILTALAADLTQPPRRRGDFTPTGGGLVETVVRRITDTLP
jgi:hypothetical protein